MAEDNTGLGEPQARILVVDDERVALKNLLRGVALATGSRLGPEQLPEDLRELRVHSYRWQPGRLPTLEAHEGDYIRWVLGPTGGNRTRAAEMLGIDRVSLWRKLKKYGIEG